MLKTADVELVQAQTVCAGKYIDVISGDVAAVTSSVKAGIEAAGSTLVDSMIIPNIDERVIRALNGVAAIEKVEAVAVMETFSLAAAVKAADAAVKAAEVDLIEVRLGRGMGGKAFVVLTGDVAAATAAVEAAEKFEEVKGLMGQSVVIPSPHKDLIQAIL